MKTRMTKSLLSLLVALSLSLSSFPLLVSALESVQESNPEVVAEDPALEELTDASAQTETDGEPMPSEEEVAADPALEKDASSDFQQFSQNIEIAEQEQQDSGYGDVGTRVKGASNTDRPYTLSQATQDGKFLDLSAYATFADAKAAMQKKAKDAPNTITKNSYVVRYASRVVAMMDGMVIALGNGSNTLSFNNSYGGRKPYVSIGTTMYYVDATSLSNITSKISGVTVQTSYDKLMLVPAPFMTNYANKSYQNNNVYQRDYYSRNASGDLVHTVTTLTKDPNKKAQYESGEKTTSSSFSFDKAPSFMKANTPYYSVNGFDFYTDPFLQNKAGTFYSYYKYLSFHSKSNYSAKELNAYLNKNMPANSVLKNTGQDFINAQSKSSINALLELAFAIHESGKGASSISRNKNNVFGINANDSNPSGDAYTFKTVSHCISEHAEIWLKQRYLDVLEDSRYFGSSIGNKAVGVNVAYASDAYHGEKIAGWAYRIDKALGGKDYNHYSIGLSKKPAPVYHNTNLLQTLYTMRNNQRNVDLAGLPVLLLQQSANSTYQIQLDLPLATATTVHFKASYSSFDHVGYIKQADVLVIKNNGFNNKVIQKRTSSITYDPKQQVKGVTEEDTADAVDSNSLQAEQDDSAIAEKNATTSSSTEADVSSATVESVTSDADATSASDVPPTSQGGSTVAREDDSSAQQQQDEESKVKGAIADSSSSGTDETVSDEPSGDGDEPVGNDSPVTDDAANVNEVTDDLSDDDAVTLLAETANDDITSDQQELAVQPLRAEQEEDFVQTSDTNRVGVLLLLSTLALFSLGGVSVILILRKRQFSRDL